MNVRVFRIWISLNQIFNNRKFSIKYCGLRFFINANNSLLDQLIHSKDGLYETSLVRDIVSEIGENDKNNCFIDIGANVGFISTYVQSLLRNISIWAFEPGPQQYFYFSKTIRYNHLKNISIYNVALSNINGEATFVTHSLEHNSGDGFLDTGRAGVGKQITVKTERIDDFVSSNLADKKIKVIKIDTEGSELLVLEGALNTIGKYKPVIYIEIWEENMQSYPYTVSEILDFFERINYNLYTLKGDLVTRNNYFKYIKSELMYKGKAKRD